MYACITWLVYRAPHSFHSSWMQLHKHCGTLQLLRNSSLRDQRERTWELCSSQHIAFEHVQDCSQVTVKYSALKAGPSVDLAIAYWTWSYIIEYVVVHRGSAPPCEIPPARPKKYRKTSGFSNISNKSRWNPSVFGYFSSKKQYKSMFFNTPRSCLMILNAPRCSRSWTPEPLMDPVVDGSGRGSATLKT